MHTRIFLPLFLLLFAGIASCKKEDEPAPLVPPLNDNSLPSGAVVQAQVTGREAGALEFTIDLTVFRDSRNIEDQLRAEDFSIDTIIQGAAEYAFERREVNLVRGASKTAYSALLLMDQSGSIATTDPDNYRIDAAKAFCSNLGEGDNVMLWSFAGSSLRQYGTGFTGEGNALIPDIQGFIGRQGGSTPLYRSQFAVTNYAATNAPNENKAVLTFTDGDDTEGGYTTEAVTDNAVAKQVRLYNVGLGSAQLSSLSRQAQRTGGAFMFAQDARQLISMFGNLGKLLNGTAHYYRTSWKGTRSNGSFSSGTLLCAARIKLPYNNSTISIPFTLTY